jgi:hypothetical protein
LFPYLISFLHFQHIAEIGKDTTLERKKRSLRQTLILLTVPTLHVLMMTNATIAEDAAPVFGWKSVHHNIKPGKSCGQALTQKLSWITQLRNLKQARRSDRFQEFCATMAASCQTKSILGRYAAVSRQQ